MRPTGSTPAVEDVGSEKQGGTQAQGEPNSHRTGTRNNIADTDTNTTTIGNNDNNHLPLIPGFTHPWEEEPSNTHAIRDQQSRG